MHRNIANEHGLLIPCGLAVKDYPGIYIEELTANGKSGGESITMDFFEKVEILQTNVGVSI